MKYAYIFSVYTKMGLFKSQKLEAIEQNYILIWIQHTQINKKTPIPILASDQKLIFVNQCNYISMLCFLIYVLNQPHCHGPDVTQQVWVFLLLDWMPHQG